MNIIDTHQHLWDMKSRTYSWCKGIPALDRSFLMSDYKVAIHGLAVKKSVHVEADVDEPFMLAETRAILALSGEPDNPLAGVVACARPENEGFTQYLDAIAGHRALKGIRRVLHTQRDELSQSSRFRDHTRKLETYHLSFDICVLARQLPLALQLVKHCPDVEFVLDHCGVPLVKERVMDPWRSDIREISRLPNIACKISGIIAYADPAGWQPEDLQPYVEHCIECFGWDRVMFGSDWPVCTQSATLKQWLETLLQLTQHESEPNRRKLFYENAQRTYRLK